MEEKEFKIMYDLTWTFEDRSKESQVQFIDSTDAYNAVATLQYVIGGTAKADIISVEETKG